MRVTLGRVRAACWEQYEAAYRQYVQTQASVKGLRARWLARSTTDLDMGCTISVWDTAADMEAYERSDAVRQEILPRLVPFLSSEFIAHHCSVECGDLSFDEVLQS